MSTIQVKKNEVKEKILEAAKVEFLEVGFQNASLRNIASKAQVTKGSIYVYFKNKDEIFTTLVQPAIDNFFTALKIDYTPYDKERALEEVYSEKRAQESFLSHVEVIIDQKEEMRLLLFCSNGSSLENFRDEISKVYIRNTALFYNHAEKEIPGFKNDITHMFMHACALLYISFIEEVIKHEPNEHELKKYISEMATFVHSGIHAIISKEASE